MRHSRNTRNRYLEQKRSSNMNSMQRTTLLLAITSAFFLPAAMADTPAMDEQAAQPQEEVQEQAPAAEPQEEAQEQVPADVPPEMRMQTMRERMWEMRHTRDPEQRMQMMQDQMEDMQALMQDTEGHAMMPGMGMGGGMMGGPGMGMMGGPMGGGMMGGPMDYGMMGGPGMMRGGQGYCPCPYGQSMGMMGGRMDDRLQRRMDMLERRMDMMQHRTHRENCLYKK
jgi:hypothetical protein